MRLLSVTSPIHWPAKDSLQAFVRERFERANSELLNRDEWIDFGSMNTESVANESLPERNDGASTTLADRTSLFWMHTETREECFEHVKFDSFGEPKRSASKDNTRRGNSTKTVVQKWDTLIRSCHEDEIVGNTIEFDCSDENSSRLRRRAQSVGVLSRHSASTVKPKNERRSFGLKDISNQTVTLKPVRGRRSFGLGDIKALSPSNAVQRLSADLSKVTLQDEKTNSSRNSHPITVQSSSDTSKRNSKKKHDFRSLEREAVASPDSDGSGFKKLLNMWNQHSPAQLQQSFSRGSPVAAENEKQPVRALVILEQPDKYDVIVGEAAETHEKEARLVVRNFRRTPESLGCDCSGSAFSGNEDLISFFLPKMGMACACGRTKNKLVNPDDPTALENILRPWQVDFLESFEIRTGEEFVKARRQSPSILARGLRQWRKKNDMVAFKTTSCATALQIWSKVCKSYVRSIRRQSLAGRTNDQLGPADAILVQEMKQFLGALPAAPERRNRASAGGALVGIVPDSQVEV